MVWPFETGEVKGLTEADLGGVEAVAGGGSWASLLKPQVAAGEVKDLPGCAQPQSTPLTPAEANQLGAPVRPGRAAQVPTWC